MRTESWFQHTSPLYLLNNTSSGWCGNYTPYEREKVSPGTYWLHHVHLPSSPYVLHATPISFSIRSPEKYWGL